jgi:hypothetical protein
MSQHSPNPALFVRKTQLEAGEHNKNFLMLDRDCLALITSKEADKVTPLMSKIYLNLLNAPTCLRERDRVLRFSGELQGETWIKAWDQLCGLLGVASATANKALTWLHEKGIIGYFAGKNGVGIRIFLNRAASSIANNARDRKTGRPQKVLTFPVASSTASRASLSEAAFKDNYVGLETQDTFIKPAAPKAGANRENLSEQGTHSNQPTLSDPPSQDVLPESVFADVLSRILTEIKPALRSASQEAARVEHERTREWLEKRGLPKAARVAQHEAYAAMARHGLIKKSAGNRDSQRHSQAEVGRGNRAVTEPRLLTSEEIEEMAHACVALRESRGQSIKDTLHEMSLSAGGFMKDEDVPKVEAATAVLLKQGSENS